MRRGRDEGAAVAEFVLISVLLVFLLFAVLQVAVFFYARNIVAASAADAARFAAAADVAPGAGKQRAEQLIADGLGGRAAIICSSRQGVDADSALAVVTVHCTGHAPALFAPIEIPLTVDVTTSALKETSR